MHVFLLPIAGGEAAGDHITKALFALQLFNYYNYGDTNIAI
jgi:hypothetical protein